MTNNSIDLLIARDNILGEEHYFQERGLITPRGNLTTEAREVVELLEGIPQLTTRAAHIMVYSKDDNAAQSLIPLAVALSFSEDVMMRKQWDYGHHCDTSSDILDTCKAYLKASQLDKRGTVEEFEDYLQPDEGNLDISAFDKGRRIENALRSHYDFYGAPRQISDDELRKHLLRVSPDLIWTYQMANRGWVNQLSGEVIRRLANRSAVKSAPTQAVVARVVNIHEGFDVLTNITVVTEKELKEEREQREWRNHCAA